MNIITIPGIIKAVKELQARVAALENAAVTPSFLTPPVEPVKRMGRPRRVVESSVEGDDAE